MRVLLIIAGSFLITPCQVAMNKKKEFHEPQMPMRAIVDTVDELARAIKKNKTLEINTILSLIFAQGIEDKIVSRSKAQEPHYTKQIQQLIEEKKAAIQKAAQETERIERRKVETPKIKKQVKLGTKEKLPEPLCNIIAEYAVD